MCFGGIQMFSKLLLSGFFVLALTLVPISAAQDNDANDTYDRPVECGEQEFHEQESSAEVNDVIDNPCDYLNREVIVQSEVDRVLSDRSFVLETDNQVFGEDHLLVIAGSPDCTVNNLDDEAEVPFGSLDEGDEAQASGVIRMFNRSELERDYGTLNLGDVDRYDFDESQPVLVACAPKAAAIIEEEVIIEEPVEEDIYIEEDVPEPAPIEPAPEPEPMPEPMPEPELPRTATGLPILGLLGMLSMALGFAIRLFR